MGGVRDVDVEDRIHLGACPAEPWETRMAVKDNIPTDVRKRAAVDNPDWYAGRLVNQRADEVPERGDDAELHDAARTRLADYRHDRASQRRQTVVHLVLTPVRLTGRLFARRRHA
jgi:hypothetical protein